MKFTAVSVITIIGLIEDLDPGGNDAPMGLRLRGRSLEHSHADRQRVAGRPGLSHRNSSIPGDARLATWVR